MCNTNQFFRPLAQCEAILYAKMIGLDQFAQDNKAFYVQVTHKILIRVGKKETNQVHKRSCKKYRTLQLT